MAKEEVKLFTDVMISYTENSKEFFKTISTNK